MTTPMFWQIVLEGFDNLSGEALSEFIENITSYAGLKFFWLPEFEGSGVLEPIYRFERAKSARIEKLLPVVKHLIQVEWATFVFSKTGLEKPEDDDFDARYARLLVNGLTVVRFVDGQYVYVYTGDDVLKEHFCRHYECQSIDKLAPPSFEWPG